MGKKETGMKKTILVSAGWILAAGMIGTAPVSYTHLISPVQSWVDAAFERKS